MEQHKIYSNNQWTTRDMSLEERFWSKVDWSLDDNQCWNWLAAGVNELGYGLFWWAGKYRPAHRIAWELEVGEIPEGMVLDHLCRNPNCVRPDHLEVVTSGENIRRGFALRVATHCARGHEYTPENAKPHPKGRQCRTCYNEARRRWRQSS